MKRNEFLIDSTIWMNLKNMPGEGTRHKRPHMMGSEISGIDKSIETGRSLSLLPGTGESGQQVVPT